MAPPRKVPKKTNGNCLASLILGLCWLGGIGSLLAIIFGFVGRKQIRESDGTQTGGALAIGGIILGLLGIAALITWIIVFAVAVHSGVSDFDRCVNNPDASGCGNSGNSGVVTFFNVFALL